MIERKFFDCQSSFSGTSSGKNPARFKDDDNPGATFTMLSQRKAWETKKQPRGCTFSTLQEGSRRDEGYILHLANNILTVALKNIFLIRDLCIFDDDKFLEPPVSVNRAVHDAGR